MHNTQQQLLRHVRFVHIHCSWYPIHPRKRLVKASERKQEALPSTWCSSRQPRLKVAHGGSPGHDQLTQLQDARWQEDGARLVLSLSHSVLLHTLWREAQQPHVKQWRH